MSKHQPVWETGMDKWHKRNEKADTAFQARLRKLGVVEGVKVDTRDIAPSRLIPERVSYIRSSGDWAV